MSLTKMSLRIMQLICPDYFSLADSETKRREGRRDEIQLTGRELFCGRFRIENGVTIE